MISVLSDNAVSFEQLRQYDYGVWFCLLSESVNDESNKIMNFIIQILSNHPEMMVVNNNREEFAYDHIIENQVSYNNVNIYHFSNSE